MKEINTIKKVVTAFCLLSSLQMSAGPLDYLLEEKKEVILDKLQKISEEDLWDIFLQNQAELCFETDFHLMKSTDWWKKAQSVLEIQCHNGTSLYKLSQQAPDKTFLGIEKESFLLEKAKERYSHDHLSFKQGDPEIFDTTLVNTSDLLVVRLTLSHLKNPWVALENAWHYLLPNGYLFIIDVCEQGKNTSHPLPILSKAWALLDEVGQKTEEINRNITDEILNQFENKGSYLSQRYTLIFKSIDLKGNVLYELPYTLGDTHRKIFFNHSLLFLTILDRFYDIPVDLNLAYDELKLYVEDQEAWTIPPVNYLVLKKI